MPYPNVNAPFGFIPLRRGGQAEMNRVRRLVSANDVNDLRINDAYKFDGAGNVTRATAATDVVAGIVEAPALHARPGFGQGGVESQDFIRAGEGGAIVGIEDANALFRVQIATFALTDVGVNTQAAVVDGAPTNLTLPQSGQSIVLDATGGHDQFKVVEILDSPADNSPGAFAKVIVQLLHPGEE